MARSGPKSAHARPACATTGTTPRGCSARCAPNAASVPLVMPWVSSEAMSLHLNAISGMVSPGAHAVLVCDGAGWHQTGGRLTLPSNVSLLPLPSYSPELNPIENVWQYLRANYLNISIWHTYEEIVDACCRAWNAFIQDIDRVMSLTRRSWATISL